MKEPTWEFLPKSLGLRQSAVFQGLLYNSPLDCAEKSGMLVLFLCEVGSLYALEPSSIDSARAFDTQ